MPTTKEMTIWKTFMTMPTTVMGMSAPYLDRAPYRTRVVFITPMMMTMDTWVSRLLMPKGRKRTRRIFRRRKESRHRRKDRPRRR